MHEMSYTRIHTKKAEVLERRFAKIRMRELLNSLHAKAFVLQMEIDSYPDKEKYKLSSTKLRTGNIMRGVRGIQSDLQS